MKTYFVLAQREWMEDPLESVGHTVEAENRAAAFEQLLLDAEAGEVDLSEYATVNLLEVVRGDEGIYGPDFDVSNLEDEGGEG